MRLVIMQPYIFPYIGYYQLIAASDRFVVYDDVNFIKQGWINRNNILMGGKASMFTVPLSDQSSFKLICETKVDPRRYESWKQKFCRTLEMNYSKAPYFEPAMAVVKDVLDTKTEYIGEIAARSLSAVCDYLRLPFNATVSSHQFAHTRHLSGAGRVKAICGETGATVYINAAGGTELYDKADFAASGLELYFLKPALKEYPQFRNDFVPYLSMIDVLMFNSAEAARDMVSAYQLV